MSTTLQSAGLRELLKLKMIMLEELKCGSVRFWPRIKESTGAPRSTVYVYLVSRQTDRQTECTRYIRVILGTKVSTLLFSPKATSGKWTEEISLVHHFP